VPGLWEFKPYALGGLVGEISLGLPQLQSWPQPDLFFVSTRRITKMTSVASTMPTAMRVCQFMIKTRVICRLGR
jgi:hypothetical protein